MGKIVMGINPGRDFSWWAKHNDELNVMSENPGRHLSDCEMSTKKFAMGKKPMVNAPGTQFFEFNDCDEW